MTPVWPLCSSAGNMINAVKTSSDSSQWTSFEWQRRLETLASARTSFSTSSSDNFDSIWLQINSLIRFDHNVLTSYSDMAELTDKGRRTTFSLGQRLRYLYVHQLCFLPDTLNRADTIYLRCSPFPRALHSVQQAFAGLYPSSKRANFMHRPAIMMRMLPEETLLPNENYCQRFIELTKAYSHRTAEKCKCYSPNPIAPAWSFRQRNSSHSREQITRARLPQQSSPKVHDCWPACSC